MPWTLVNTTNSQPIILDIAPEDLQTDVADAKTGVGDLVKSYEEQSMGTIYVNLLEVVVIRPYDPQ